MTKKVSSAEAKANLSALVAEVAYGGARIIIERRGKPMAVLVSISDLERMESEQVLPAGARGALALVGIWGELPDEEIDAMVAEIYRQRDEETSRPIDLEE